MIKQYYNTANFPFLFINIGLLEIGEVAIWTVLQFLGWHLATVSSASLIMLVPTFFSLFLSLY